MEFVKFSPLSPRARAAGAVFSLVSSLVGLSSVVGLFASESGELQPVVAWLQPAPAASASEVASKQLPLASPG